MVKMSYFEEKNINFEPFYLIKVVKFFSNFELKSLWGAIQGMWTKNFCFFLIFVIMKIEKTATQIIATIDEKHCILNGKPVMIPCTKRSIVSKKKLPVRFFKRFSFI